jgi:16S rRNA (adenine1518-N6/adenine1519-N6)-dimethyltransferase
MLSQNFLIDKRVLAREVDYANVNKKDTVLEIGAGTGNLTSLLAEKAKKVIAVEIDELVAKKIPIKNNIELVIGDFLKVGLPKFDKVVSNIPYHISSPITFKLFEFDWSVAVICYQKEFAQRFFAKPCESDYSRLTVDVNYFCEPEMLEIVPKNLFRPIPEVDSMIVKLVKRKTNPWKVKDEKKFFHFVNCLFQHKNQNARKALIHSQEKLGMSKEEVKNRANSDLFKKRAREMSGEELARLCEEFHK